MRKPLVVAILSLFVAGCSAQDKGQPVYGKTTPNPVVVPDDEPEYKRSCITVKDKTGKNVQKCKQVKIHKKLDGTAVPPKK